MGTTGPIGVALIGFGSAGRTFHAPLLAATPGLSLRAVGSSQSAAVAARFPDVAVLADPPAAIAHDEVSLVVLATPNETHAPLAAAALRAGRHVVVDKPFTITHAEATALAGPAAERGRILSVFQNRRWDSDFLAIEAAVRGGAIGRVVELRSEISRWRPQVRDRWRERPGPGSGLCDLGPHLVDQALVLFGPPDTVQADLRIQRHGGTTIDWFHVVLGYASCRVLLSSSMLAAEAGVRFLVRGTDGAMVKRTGDVQEAQLQAGGVPGAPGWGVDPNPLVLTRSDGTVESRAAPAGDYLAHYAGIRDAIIGPGLPPVSPAQATAVMAVIEAGLLSAAEQRAVGVDFTAAERVAHA